LSFEPRRAPVGARHLAGRPARDPAPSARERLAPDLRILHDLGSPHHARLPARPLPVRVRGRARRSLPRALHADAPSALRRAVRAFAAHPAHRPDLSCRAVRLEPPGHERSPAMIPRSRLKAQLRAGVALAAVLAQLAALASPAAAFCGFYVAKADSKLFNKSSKVVLARDGETTAITMASDYEGEPKEFALVIPVPTFIERKQIGVVEMKTIDHLDAFTAPRLVEYHDPDPCAMPVIAYRMDGAVPVAPTALAKAELVRYRGVTVEASYDVGEYDVSILSASESDGLVNWLNDNGYRIPAGADAVLGSYIKQKMRFFVAKVNLDRMQLLGAGYLRPLQVR